jgi:hypothetical protein
MRLWPRPVYEWGSTAAERALRFDCDEVIAAPADVLFRAVDVEAAAPILYRWLCQLQVAPYSYDRLDNGGRRSPQTLTPGLEELVPGQRMVSIFRLHSFEPGRSLTIVSRGRLFGHVACTYVAEPAGRARSRLLVKMLVDYSPIGPARAAMRWLLPPGDLVMMRRQLLNLKGLAEAQAATAA